MINLVETNYLDKDTRYSVYSSSLYDIVVIWNENKILKANIKSINPLYPDFEYKDSKFSYIFNTEINENSYNKFIKNIKSSKEFLNTELKPFFERLEQ